MKSNKKIIHVNRQNIAMNTKDNKDRPVYTIKMNGKIYYAKEVIIHGPSKLVYDGKQLSCGARAWIETESDIEMIGQCTFEESRKVK